VLQYDHSGHIYAALAAKASAGFDERSQDRAKHHFNPGRLYAQFTDTVRE
jgi:hypothetical protein